MKESTYQNKNKIIKPKALVFGNFGYQTNEFCGQTVKTMSVYELLKTKENFEFSEVNYFDTHTYQISKLNFFKSIIAVAKTDVLYYLPASKNLNYLSPILYFLSKIFSVEIHLIVIGGWLSEYLASKRVQKWILSRIKRIYPETKALCENLKTTHKIKNVVQLNNFRNTNFINPVQMPINKVKLVFMGRIHPLKGVDTIFKLSQKLDELKLKNVIIDFYGPIIEDYKLEFETKLQSSSKNIKYKGILKPAEIYGVLSKYDLLLFPTRFYSEGFPGSLLDAYIVGLPVIATKWMFASEFILDNQSGIIVEFDNTESFIDKVVDLVKTSDKIINMRKGVINFRNRFSSKNAWEVLKNNL